MPGRIRLAAAAAIALAAAAAGGQEARTVTKPGTFGPPKDAKWVVIGELTDEFEGDKLDAAKWWDHNPTWKGRQPAFFAKHNVAVRDGKLHLTMRREDLPSLPKGYHTFTSAAVKSKAKVRYGFFEIKARPMDSHGSSAFWFYDGTPEIWTEIDVFEMGAGAPKHQHVDHINVHVFHTLVNPDRHWHRPKQYKAPFRLADGYHVYALDWGPESLRFLVDGECVRTVKNTHWHQPLYLNFDSETMPRWFGLPKADDLPSTFSIEYVRAWRRADEPGRDRPTACEVRFPGRKAAKAGAKATHRLKTKAGGAVLVVATHGEADTPRLVHLVYEDRAFFAAQTLKEVRKAVTLRDKAGKALRLRFRWSKVAGWKKHNGYRAEWVDLGPAERPPGGEPLAYDFTAEDGQAVRVTLRY